MYATTAAFVCIDVVDAGTGRDHAFPYLSMRAFAQCWVCTNVQVRRFAQALSGDECLNCYNDTSTLDAFAHLVRLGDTIVRDEFVRPRDRVDVNRQMHPLKYYNNFMS